MCLIGDSYNVSIVIFFFFKQKTAYEMRISDWSSDVCSSDLIPLPLQVKLLRFLQERTIERIGGRKAIAVDTRIVCATHRDLDTMIAQQSFRDDLYYRLAEMVVKIPSLAERPGDAVLLARHFLHQYAPEQIGRANV